MSDIVKEFGRRVRNYRNKAGLSQEKLAELCGLHATYIGQVERGEKNCTLESADKISKGPGVPLEQLICKINTVDYTETFPNEIYREVQYMGEENQRNILEIIQIISDMIK